jgi:redox-sensitive bicupin YhaK (pirin superfamily)
MSVRGPHKDSLGNEGQTEAGDVQVMSAGAGYPARRIQPG